MDLKQGNWPSRYGIEHNSSSDIKPIVTNTFQNNTLQEKWDKLLTAYISSKRTVLLKTIYMNANLIYFVDLNDFLVCENLLKTNQLFTPFIAHYQTYKTVYPLYTIDLELLLNEKDADQIGFASPRFQYISLENWARNGLVIGLGEKNQENRMSFVPYPPKQLQRIKKTAELEIEFEKIRRIVDITLPSRLSCVFLAEDNFSGRNMLKNMFYNKPNFVIIEMEVSYALLQHKADSRWVDEYEKNNDILYIYNYWFGITLDNDPQYEYLIEGVIKMKNIEDAEMIKERYKYYHKD